MPAPLYSAIRKTRDMRSKVLASLNASYDWEMRCGYDERIGMASVAHLIEITSYVPLIPIPRLYRLIVLAIFDVSKYRLYLSGEYSGSLSSMNSAISRARDSTK